eukprot:PhM_4_TR10059/c3_g1_i4/m.42563
MAYPPPPHVQVIRFHCYARPVELRQQRLRYRRAAAHAAALSRDRLGNGIPHSMNSPQPPFSPSPSQPSSPQPARDHARTGVRLATFNARTLTDQYAVHHLAAYADLRGIDAIAVQETRANTYPETLISECSVVSTPATSDGHHGVALFLGKRCTLLEWTEIVPHRALKARVRIKLPARKYTLTILACYFPQRTDPQQSSFIETIISHCNEGPTAVLCDANGAAPAMTTQGRMTDCTLAKPRWTWRPNDTAPRHHWKRIDHILVKKIGGQCTNITYEQPRTSDHRLVCAHIHLRRAPPEHTDMTQRIKLDKLAYDGQARHKFNAQYAASAGTPTSLTDLADALRVVPCENDPEPTPTCSWHPAHAATAALERTSAEEVLEEAAIMDAEQHLDQFATDLSSRPWLAWKHISATQHRHATAHGAIS